MHVSQFDAVSKGKQRDAPTHKTVKYAKSSSYHTCSCVSFWSSLP